MLISGTHFPRHSVFCVSVVGIEPRALYIHVLWHSSSPSSRFLAYLKRVCVYELPFCLVWRWNLWNQFINILDFHISKVKFIFIYGMKQGLNSETPLSPVWVSVICSAGYSSVKCFTSLRHPRGSAAFSFFWFSLFHCFNYLFLFESLVFKNPSMAGEMAE